MASCFKGYKQEVSAQNKNKQKNQELVTKRKEKWKTSRVPARASRLRQVLKTVTGNPQCPQEVGLLWM